jgi:exopolysaccharide biosynthesis protein
MNYVELAEEMVRLGCHEALNLDGGGSSLLAVRHPAESDYDIINQPTDGRERPVANVLGISVSPAASSEATRP